MRKIPLGAVVLTLGLSLTVMGFIAYALDRPTLNLVGFFYGIPILIGGLALKSAEIEPVPNLPPPSEAILRLRDQFATETQNQVRKDVTRYRYGQEAHLDSALEYLGLSPTDEERPVLTAIREQEQAGHYVLVLCFDSPKIAFEGWEKKHGRITKFFGPNIEATLHQPQEHGVELALMSTVG
ncbi:MAG: DUF2854 domain-containing protein [Synechococcales cyanobacterium RM1_1_8]|nr:DUF2854 domain-containing protein [Synechococcales cyanobacterium RM1_1_8]